MGAMQGPCMSTACTCARTCMRMGAHGVHPMHAASSNRSPHTCDNPHTPITLPLAAAFTPPESNPSVSQQPNTLRYPSPVQTNCAIRLAAACAARVSSNEPPPDVNLLMQRVYRESLLAEPGTGSQGAALQGAGNAGSACMMGEAAA